jgi:hypothetical protein
MRSRPMEIQFLFLNDFIFCPRRAALKGIEGQWGENAHTALSDLLHERADDRG